MKELELGRPYSFRGYVIYISRYTTDLQNYEIEYLTRSEWRRYEARYEIPESSVKDGTYRSLAERRHMRPPISQSLHIKRRDLKKLTPLTA